jgi:N6-adenosine-specific RNA methylase IME4
VAAHLAADGLVAVWVTNAPRFTDLLLRPSTSSSSRREGGGSSGGGGDGVFAEWGVELVGEWTWVKVTTGGEPVVAIHSAWRKPWERLLIARNKVSGRGGVGGPGKAGAVRGKVIVSVPDVHSRKPNLRGLFEGEEGLLPEGYEALEVFARNLTAGWCE